jgi:hypothetical protein
MRKTYLAQQTQEANTASTGEAGPDAGSLGGPDADGGQPE